MSKRFADFLEEQGIEFAALDSEDQRQLRLQFSDSHPEGESMTVQSDRDVVDINRIVARHKVAGLPLPEADFRFGDATQVLSYEEALGATARAREMFGRLPARVRARFENDPGQLLAFARDSANLEEAYQLGLVKRPSVRQPPQGAPSEPPVEGASGGAPPLWRSRSGGVGGP